MSEKLLVLAEGFSGDPHYGKTARGVLAYGQRPVVALLDSTRAGETQGGVPIVARSTTRSASGRRRRSSASRTQGGRFPPAWRELLQHAASAGARTSRTGLHEFLGDDAEMVDLRRAGTRVELRDLRRPPADLNVPTGANLELPVRTVLTVGSECAIGKMTVSLELEREARSRGLARRVRPDRPDRNRDRRLGHRRRRGRLRLPRRRGRAARRRGHERGGELLLVEGQGSLIHPAYSGVTLGLVHGSAPHAFVLCHLAGADGGGGLPRPPDPVAPGARRAARADRLAGPAGPGRGDRAQHAEARRATTAHDAIAAAETETRARRRRSGPFRPGAAARRRSRRATRRALQRRCRPPISAGQRHLRQKEDDLEEDHCGARALPARSCSPPRRPPSTSARTTTAASTRRTAARPSSARWPRPG